MGDGCQGSLGERDRKKRKWKKIIYIYFFLLTSPLSGAVLGLPLQELEMVAKGPWKREKKSKKKKGTIIIKKILFFFAFFCSPPLCLGTPPHRDLPSNKKNIYIYIFFFFCRALPPKALLLPLFLCMLAYGRAFLWHIHLTSMACLWHVYGVPLLYLQIVNLWHVCSVCL